MPSQIEAWISTNSLHGIAWKFNSEKNLAPLQDLKATDIYTEVLLQRVVNYLRWEDGVLVRGYLSSYWLPSTCTRQCAIEKRSVCFDAYLSNMLACCSWPLSGEVSSACHICGDREDLLLRSSPRIRDIFNYCRACSSGAITICDQRFVTARIRTPDLTHVMRTL